MLEEIIEEYLDDQWQWQHLLEQEQYEEEYNKQDRQPDHLHMINEYEWKEWLGI